MVRVKPQATGVNQGAPGLALHAAAARVEALLKERERLLREVSRRKRLIEQARASAQRDGNEAARKLGPLFLRQQTLVRELTALFDALQSEPRPARARNIIGKLRASLQERGVLEPLSHTETDPATETETETETDSDTTARYRRPPRSSTASSPPDLPSAPQPAPERRPLREIFRTLARALHPDQARTDVERSRRTQVMKEITRAYAQGDLARLLELESEWQVTRAPVPDASEGNDSLARCQELQRTNRELLKQVRQLTGELKDAKDDARRASPRSLTRTARSAAHELEQLEALCELVREFKRGNRSLAELALGEFLI